MKILDQDIEIDKLEELLSQHPAVREAAVVTRGEEGRDQQLVAYIVTANSSRSLQSDELKEYLSGRQPEHLVPAAFVMLDHLPRDGGANVDRQALSESNHSGPQSQTGYLAPRTSVEKTVAEIWAEVLGVGQVGVHDNFFELGGHSVLVMRVASRLYKVFKVDLSMHDFFKSPTVTDISATIAHMQAESQGPEKPIE